MIGFWRDLGEIAFGGRSGSLHFGNYEEISHFVRDDERFRRKRMVATILFNNPALRLRGVI